MFTSFTFKLQIQCENIIKLSAINQDKLFQKNMWFTG